MERMPTRLRRRTTEPTQGARPAAPPIFPYQAGAVSRSPQVIYVRPCFRAAEIITIAVLVAALVLLGLGGIFWMLDARLVLGPTPTPTPTSVPPVSPTPDIGATRVVEDFLTQQAYQAALLGTLTPPPPGAATTPGLLLPEAGSSQEITGTPTMMSVVLPGISVSGPV
jgi:hypothetical protein